MAENTEKKKTVPNPAVGAAEGQSTDDTNIVAQHAEEINATDIEIDPVAKLAALQRRSEQLANPNYLHTVSMVTLFDQVYMTSPPIVEGLLFPGTYILAGPPKSGKSFLVTQISYCVAAGVPIWDRQVTQGTVLYLALEDDLVRLQHRLYRMFDGRCSEHLELATGAHSLFGGLCAQLEYFLSQKPDTRLVVIDTLQKVSDAAENYSYSRDYEVISSLKQISDRYRICIVLVHHTRKQYADDKVNMISGTTGLTGAADALMVMYKEQRTSSHATLEIVGRDQGGMTLHLSQEPKRLIWNLDRIEGENLPSPPDPVLAEVNQFLTTTEPMWKGTASALAEAIACDIKPNQLTRKLNCNAYRLMEEYGINYEANRTATGRYITLRRKDA